MHRIILEQHILTPQLHWITLVSENAESFQPGQFLLVHCTATDSYDPWLMEAFWIVRASDQTVTIHVPITSRSGRWLAQQPRGVQLRTSPIVGAPFKAPARTLLSISQGFNQGLLIAILEQTIKAGGSALLLSSGPVEQRIPAWTLAPDVEYLATETNPLDLLAQNLERNNPLPPLQWADQVLFAGTTSIALELQQRIRQERLRWTRDFAWYAPATSLLCSSGICGSCWVTHGAKASLACQHGLFYDLYDLRASTV